MFDYCTSGLGYSSSAAARRIRTARCVTRFPEVFALLEKNEVNLSTVSQVSRFLSVENKDRLLARIRGKSQREVEAIVAEYEPRVMPPDRGRPVVVRIPASTAATAGGGAAPTFNSGAAQPVAIAGDSQGSLSGEASPAGAGSKHCRSGSEIAPSVPTEKRMLLSFSASEEFMTKLEKIKSLAWHRLPANPSLEQVFELVMDCFIQKEDPSARRRRDVRKDVGGEARSTGQQRAPGARYIAASVKDEVFTRDRGRCTYVGASGRRCASTRALQIDHIEPIARGGKSTRGNLRLLCAFHNRLEAERILGTVGRCGTAPSPPP
jgi:5-methylcytosine-specific restriction endonuclease McrA